MANEGTVLDVKNFTALQAWFDEGWEYVDHIQQNVSAGSYGSKYPAIGAIIRKEKESITL